MVEIFIENIIASADMGGDLDLEGIMKQFPNCEYNPNQFPGVVFRPDEPKVVMLFFNDGKVMVTAAKSINDVENSIEKAAKELKEKGLVLAPGEHKPPAEIPPAETPPAEAPPPETEQPPAEAEAPPPEAQGEDEGEGEPSEEPMAIEEPPGEEEGGEKKKKKKKKK